MQFTSRDFVKAILLTESFDSRDQIRSVVLPLFEKSTATIVEKLSTLLLIANSHKMSTLQECLQDIQTKFIPVMEILKEQCIKLPEEEAELSKMVKAIYEEGEGAAPTNTSDSIDASTPRIKRKQTAEIDDKT